MIVHPTPFQSIPQYHKSKQTFKRWDMWYIGIGIVPFISSIYNCLFLQIRLSHDGKIVDKSDNWIFLEQLINVIWFLLKGQHLHISFFLSLLSFHLLFWSNLWFQKTKRPSTNFMEKIQKDINASMRAMLIDWLVEVNYGG